MPMDAYRQDGDLWVHINLPGVSPDDLDVSVERKALTVSAQRDLQREGVWTEETTATGWGSPTAV
jgi:HSP20 family protein